MSANIWNQRFGNDEYAYGRQPNDFLREQSSRLPKEAKILCVGDGEGRNGVFLATLGHHVTSVDYAEQGLRKARRLAEEHNVSIDTVLADLAEYRAQEKSFDAVVSIFCHLPANIRRHLHGDLERILKPTGLFILEAYTPAQLAFGTGGPKDRSLLYSLDELRDDLAAFDFVIAREVERDVVEGSLHTGRAATVQIVAQTAR